MNRAERRRQMRLNESGTGLLVSGGVDQEARSKFHVRWPDPVPGQHLWTMSGAWRVADPAVPQHNLDLENLIALEGPGCLWCEEGYTPELAARPCTGDASAR